MFHLFGKRSCSAFIRFRLTFVLTTLAGMFLFVMCHKSQMTGVPESSEKWVGTWGTAPQLVEPRNNPPEPGLSHNTIRQIVRVSLGGDKLRVRFSNEFSTRPVVMKAVQIANSEGNGIIDPDTEKALLFSGSPEVTLAPGSVVISDPLHYSLKPRSDVAITLHFGDTSPDVTGHPGSRTTSYLLTGNAVSERDFSGGVRTDHWYVINGIDIMAPKSAAAIAIVGNSITDGRGSGTNKQNRWPDELARRLQEQPETRHIAVLNMGIGGNCVLRDCLGPAALSRFERDVLRQQGVRWLIVLEGINDIGGARGPEASSQVAEDLIDAYRQMINAAHAADILVYGATLMPFGGSFYDSPDHEAARERVNRWIRTSGRFDAVIDLDAALRQPENPRRLLTAADTGDHLHPSETGHRMMAEAVDLTLFR